MKKNKISKNWVNRQRRDIYVRQSKVDGYRARSAYKLIEIDEKFIHVEKDILDIKRGVIFVYEDINIQNSDNMKKEQIILENLLTKDLKSSLINLILSISVFEASKSILT